MLALQPIISHISSSSRAVGVAIQGLLKVFLDCRVTALLAMTVLLIGVVTENTLASAPSSQTFTLKNGMQVVVIPNHKVPAVSHMVWYKIGALDEPQGISGIAHFLEHLMFKGTKKYGPGEFSSTIARNGGEENAFTSWDYTGYFQNISVEKLPLAMELEADRMINLALNPQEVLRERDVIIEERRSRVDNQPRALLSEQMRAALYTRHPYGTPLIGWLDEMRKLSLEDAKTFYRNYYAPNNAILIVSGDITAEKLKPLAEKYYGSIPSHPIPARIIPDEPEALAERRVTLYDKRVQKPEFLRFYLAPSQTYGETKYAYALSVLSEILGGGPTSRMYQNLVVDSQLASFASSSYDELGRGPIYLSLHAVPKPGVSLAQIEEAINTVVKTIVAQGITREELERTKRSLRADTLYSRDGFRTFAYAYGQALATGLPVSYVEQWDNKIDAVTLDDVKAAAAYVLQARKSVTGLLEPETKEEE